MHVITDCQRRVTGLARKPNNAVPQPGTGQCRPASSGRNRRVLRGCPRSSPLDRLPKPDVSTHTGDVPAGRDVDYFHKQPVPEALTELVRYHSHRISKYLYFAMDEGHWRNDFAEWQAMTLYKLTDAMAQLRLMIGTITAYLRDEGVDEYFLRRYLQVNEDRQVQEYLTPRAEEHLAGLTGKPEPEHTGVWHSVGSDIAARTGWSAADRHEALEAALHAHFCNYPDDAQALDHLPSALKEQVLTLIPLLRTVNTTPHEAAD
ncbi:hypothetical protein [Streptomyces sp. NPDC090994]|uniref:hypothetical protein n=1 Tax=Streptomyces sp. NPDC090994 TaxID=3365969 RepID=UPI00381E729E